MLIQRRRPLSANITLQHVDLAATGFIDPASGLGGVLDYTGTVKSDGKNAHSEGIAKADKLRLMPSGGPARSLVTVDYASDYNLASRPARFSRGEIHTGKSTVHLSGNFNMQGPSPVCISSSADRHCPWAILKDCCLLLA